VATGATRPRRRGFCGGGELTTRSRRARACTPALDANMPTLPLYDPAPTNPDDPHRVAAPGGYECWRFDAEDSAANFRVVAKLWDGYAFDPAYLRRYALYRRFPTRVDP